MRGVRAVVWLLTVDAVLGLVLAVIGFIVVLSGHGDIVGVGRAQFGVGLGMAVSG